MGEISRARDAHRGRDVAVEVLRVDVASHTDRPASFERDARTVAGLNRRFPSRRGQEMRIAIAAVLGVCSFVLMFFLGGSVRVPPTVWAAEYITGLIFIVGMGGYFLISMYLLSRGLPKGSRKGWVILALNAALLLASVIALVVEPNKLETLQVLGTAVLGVACSYAGSALATRTAGPR